MKNRLLILSTAVASLTVAAACVVLPSSTATGAVVNMSVTAPTPPTGTPPVPTLPYGATEVMKMYQGGIHKDLILNYINNTTLPCHLSADAIIYLQSTGLPQDITQAMIVRDGQLNQMAGANPSMMPPPGQPYPPQGQPYPPPMAGQGQVAMPTTPAPDVSGYGYGDYGDYGSPYYDTGSPYYYGGYPYYWGWWPGWGWGWRGWSGNRWGGGFRGGFGRGGFGGFHGGFGGVGGFRGGGFAGGFHGGGFAGGFHGGGFAGGHASAGFGGGHAGGGFGGGHGGGGGHR